MIEKDLIELIGHKGVELPSQRTMHTHSCEEGGRRVGIHSGAWGKGRIRLTGKIARRLFLRTQVLQTIVPRKTNVGECTPNSRQRAMRPQADNVTLRSQEQSRPAGFVTQVPQIQRTLREFV